MTHARRPFELALFGAAAAVFVLLVVAPARNSQGFDLAPLAAAGRLVAKGEASHLYDHDPRYYNVTASPAFEYASRETGFHLGSTPFVYPPLVALAMQPVSALDFRDVMAVWTWLSALFVIASLWLALQLYTPAWNRPLTWAGGLALLCAFEPVRYGFWLGQTTPSILVMILGALLLARRQHGVAAGVVLALAAFIKLTPGLFALLWLWRGPRRAFWSFTVATLGLWLASVAVLGLDLHATYIARVREIGGSVVTAFNNHSLLAAATRLGLDGATLDFTVHQPPRAIWAAVTLVLLAFATAAYRLLRTLDDEPFEALGHGFAFLFILIAPSISWTHYFVFLLPITLGVLAQTSSVAAAPALVGCLLCCRPVATLIVPMPTVAAMLVAASILWTARRAQRAT